MTRPYPEILAAWVPDGGSTYAGAETHGRTEDELLAKLAAGPGG